MSKKTFTKAVFVAGGFAASGFATAQAAEVDNPAPEINIAQEYTQPTPQEQTPVEVAVETPAEPVAENPVENPVAEQPAAETPANEIAAETPAPVVEEPAAPVADTPAPVVNEPAPEENPITDPGTAKEPAPVITPVDPAEPTEPIVDVPVEPVNPEQPAEPTDPANPEEPTPAEPTDPGTPEEPPVTEPVEPTEPPHFVEENPQVQAGNGQAIAIDGFTQDTTAVTVTLTDADNAQVQIIDEQGNAHDAYVQSVNPDGTVNFIINTTGMNPGSYTLHVSGHGFDELSTGLTVNEANTPVDPNQPTDPVEPSDPNQPVDPTQPVEPTDPANPAEPTDPTNPVDPANPTQPIDPGTPEQPSEPTNPVDPTQPVNPVEPSDPTQPTQPEEPGTPTNPAEPTPEEPTTPVEPTQPTQPATPETKTPAIPNPVETTEPSVPGQAEQPGGEVTPQGTPTPEEQAQRNRLVVTTADQVRPMTDPANIPAESAQPAPVENPQVVSRAIPSSEPVAPEDEPTPNVGDLKALPMALERKLESREFSNPLEALLPGQRQDKNDQSQSVEFGQDLQAGALPQRTQGPSDSAEQEDKGLSAQSVPTRSHTSDNTDSSVNNQADSANPASENKPFNWTPVIGGLLVLLGAGAVITLLAGRRKEEQ